MYVSQGIYGLYLYAVRWDRRRFGAGYTPTPSMRSCVESFTRAPSRSRSGRPGPGQEESAWPRGLPYAKGDEGIDFAIDTTTNVERVLDDAESVLAIPPVYSSLHVQKERGDIHPTRWPLVIQ